MSQVVLITGCSTGIGRNLALRLAQAGYTVAATARGVETLAGLPAALKLPLDVTRPESIQKAVVREMFRMAPEEANLPGPMEQARVVER